jgi:hypothetical protein
MLSVYISFRFILTLEFQVGWFTADNATNDDTAIKAIAASLMRRVKILIRRNVVFGKVQLTQSTMFQFADAYSLSGVWSIPSTWPRSIS